MGSLLARPGNSIPLRNLSRPSLERGQFHCAGVCVSGETGKICCSRWLNVGDDGSIIHAVGAGGFSCSGQLLATAGGNGDAHPLTSNSEVSRQAISIGLGILQFSISLLVEQ